MDRTSSTRRGIFRLARNRKSRYILLGLGRFGAALARGLAEKGHRVVGVDIDEETVRDLEEMLDEALVADATDREVLQATNVQECAALFVAMGDEPLRNIIAAMHAVELSAPRIIARGTDHEHARILRKLGDIQVILPEQDMGRYLAERMHADAEKAAEQSEKNNG